MHLRYALADGADAVYAGQPRYSLRVRTNSFKNEAALAEVIDADDHWLTLAVKNRFELGDEVLLITPGGNRRWRLDALENRQGEAIRVAPGDGHVVRVPRPEGPGDEALGFAYGWFSMPIERPDLSHIARWYERLCGRPAFQSAVMTPPA